MPDLFRWLQELAERNPQAVLAWVAVAFMTLGIIGGAAGYALTARQSATEERLRLVEAEAVARERVLLRQLAATNREMDVLREAFASLAADLRSLAGLVAGGDASEDVAGRLTATAAEIELALDRAALTRAVADDLLGAATERVPWTLPGLVVALLALLGVVLLWRSALETAALGRRYGESIRALHASVDTDIQAIQQRLWRLERTQEEAKRPSD